MPKTITEEEAVWREQKAFVSGSSWELGCWHKMLNIKYSTGSDAVAESRSRYPLKEEKIEQVSKALDREFRPIR